MLRLIYFILVIALISCNVNDKNGSASIISADTSLDEPSKYSDSLIKSEEHKALGGIKFGMPEKEVKKLIGQFKDSNKRPDDILGSPHYNYYIGNFEFSEIWDFYQDNRLYQLTVLGRLIGWDSYNKEIAYKITSISEVLSQKFGKPDEENPIPETYKMENGFSYLIQAWEIGEKRIEVRITDNGTSYTPKVILYDRTMVAQINRQEEAKKDSIKKATKNAF